LSSTLITPWPRLLSIDVPYEVKQEKGYGYEPANGGMRILHHDIKAGQQIMNGTVALEYARLRHVRSATTPTTTHEAPASWS